MGQSRNGVCNLFNEFDIMKEIGNLSTEGLMALSFGIAVVLSLALSKLIMRIKHYPTSNWLIFVIVFTSMIAWFFIKYYLNL